MYHDTLGIITWCHTPDCVCVCVLLWLQWVDRVTTWYHAPIRRWLHEYVSWSVSSEIVGECLGECSRRQGLLTAAVCNFGRASELLRSTHGSTVSSYLCCVRAYQTILTIENMNFGLIIFRFLIIGRLCLAEYKSWTICCFYNQGSHPSAKLLEVLTFRKISRLWKVLKNQFGSWIISLVPESAGNYTLQLLKLLEFSSGSNFVYHSVWSCCLLKIIETMYFWPN